MRRRGERAGNTGLGPEVQSGGGHPSCAHRALEYSGLGFKASVSERSPQALTSRRHQKERGVKADGLWVVLWDDGMNVLELDRRRGFTTLRMP